MGARFTFPTVMRVVADPASALVARNTTVYGVDRASLNVGVQVKVPEVCAGFDASAALFPTGSPETSAVSDPIGSPSGSVAVTGTLTATFSVAGRTEPETELRVVTRSSSPSPSRSASATSFGEPATGTVLATVRPPLPSFRRIVATLLG